MLKFLKLFLVCVCGLQKCVIKTTLSLAKSQGVSSNIELVVVFFFLNALTQQAVLRYAPDS